MSAEEFCDHFFQRPVFDTHVFNAVVGQEFVQDPGDIVARHFQFDAWRTALDDCSVLIEVGGKFGTSELEINDFVCAETIDNVGQ